MVRNRPFVMGLGLGLIFGALLLQLMLFSEQQTGRATEFDEAMQSNQDSGGYTEEQVQALLLEQEAQLRAEFETEPGTADSGEQDELSTLVRIVNIQSGSTLEETAVLLQDYGLIEDRYRFIRSMSEQSGKIRSGRFYFQGIPSEEEVKNKITNDPILSVPID